MSYEVREDAELSRLIGKTLKDIIVDYKSDTIDFYCADGERYVLRHVQQCCESVTIKDVVGDVRALVGSPILVSECSTNDDDESAYATWTFYKFATAKGWVDISWYGTSNGWYSEKVDFEYITTKKGPNESTH